MDSTSTWIGVTMIILGVAGIFLTYSGISHTFEMGMQGLSALILFLGIIIFAGGLARGGFPNVKPVHIASIGLVVFIGTAGLTVSAVTYSGPFKLLKVEEEFLESPIKVFVDIIPGSWDPAQPDNYVPKNIRVLVGVNHTVVWINKEDIDVSHTVTHINRLFDSGLFGPGLNWSYSFREPGLYQYFCIPHPWMRGSVEVERLSSEEVQEILASLGLGTEE
ncbi:MAG: plastocyanin/azurin family copper-binding protein [Nitrososphaerota archaeon]|nr:plastocyanin/azurin family copper-binding protein [Candidatus Calditenuaceae archaeon]MDW8073040.1 plastocyanin/azurin family copper-binding protein [Nitrososphaerota archaeon]